MQSLERKTFLANPLRLSCVRVANFLNLLKTFSTVNRFLYSLLSFKEHHYQTSYQLFLLENCFFDVNGVLLSAF